MRIISWIESLRYIWKIILNLRCQNNFLLWLLLFFLFLNSLFCHFIKVIILIEGLNKVLLSLVILCLGKFSILKWGLSLNFDAVFRKIIHIWLLGFEVTVTCNFLLLIWIKGIRFRDMFVTRDLQLIQNLRTWCFIIMRWCLRNINHSNTMEFWSVIHYLTFRLAFLLINSLG